MILYNGNFITLNDKAPTASALAVKDGKIFQVGSNADVKHHQGECTKVIDLGGKTAVPGFIDSHIHLISLGLDMQVIDLRGVTTKKSLLSMLKSAVRDTPSGNWVKGYGFDEARMDELPDVRELTSVAPENAVYLESLDYLTCVVNNQAMAKVDIHPRTGVILDTFSNTDDPPGVTRVSDEK
mgnify:CR=1 FL=1